MSSTLSDSLEFTRAQPETVPGSPGKLQALGSNRRRVEEGASEVVDSGGKASHKSGMNSSGGGGGGGGRGGGGGGAGRGRGGQQSSASPAVTSKHAAIGADYLEALGGGKGADPFWSEVISAANDSAARSNAAIQRAQQPSRSASPSPAAAAAAAASSSAASSSSSASSSFSPSPSASSSAASQSMPAITRTAPTIETTSASSSSLLSVSASSSPATRAPSASLSALSSSSPAAPSSSSSSQMLSAPSPPLSTRGVSPGGGLRRAAPQASTTHLTRPEVITTSASARSHLQNQPGRTSPAPLGHRSHGNVLQHKSSSAHRDIPRATAPSPAPTPVADLDSVIAAVESEFREARGRKKTSARSAEMALCNEPFLELALDYFELVDFPTSLTLNILNGGACSHLTHLILKGNRIVNLPPAIGQLSQLVELNVEDNLLTTLPRDIQHLRKLQRLHASGNKMSVVVNELCECSELRRVFLSNNRILKLPPDICKLKKLRWLDLSNNLLFALPGELSTLPRLGWLDLTNNQITCLPVELGNLRSLNALILLKNPIDADRGLPLNLMDIKTLQDLRLDIALNVPSTLLASRDTHEIHTFLTDMIMRWDLQLNDRSHWEPNEATSKCRACAMTFTLTKRRHHCRVCGLIFCHKDCSRTLDLPAIGIGRVCEPCYKKLDPANPANQYLDRQKRKLEEQAAKTYGLTAADETMPLEHRIKMLEGQVAELTEQQDAIFRSQDALQKMLEIYAGDAGSLADAEQQINVEKQKLRGIMLTKSRVQAMLATLTEDKKREEELSD